MKLLYVAMLASLLAFVAGCVQPQTTAEDPVKRGEYLTTIGGCHDCHTPKVMDANGMPVLDTTKLLSGHPAGMPYPTWTPEDLQNRHAIALTNPMLSAWGGPWGVSFAMNLTPDVATGIGEWTEETFIQVMRTGKHQGQPNGRDILPPMPWQSFQHAPEQDLKAIWAYLRTIPAINNAVPLPVPPGAMPE